MPDDWNESIGWEFLKYIWRFNSDKRPKIIKVLAGSKDIEIVIFKNRAQVNVYLEKI